MYDHFGNLNWLDPMDMYKIANSQNFAVLAMCFVGYDLNGNISGTQCAFADELTPLRSPMGVPSNFASASKIFL